MRIRTNGEGSPYASASSVAALAANVEAIEKDVQSIVRTLNHITERIEAQQEPKWGTIGTVSIGAVSVIATLWIAAINPIKEVQQAHAAEIIQNETAQRSFEREMNNTLSARNHLFISQEQFNEYKSAAGRVDDRVAARANKAFDLASEAASNAKLIDDLGRRVNSLEQRGK